MRKGRVRIALGNGALLISNDHVTAPWDQTDSNIHPSKDVSDVARHDALDSTYPG